MSGKRWKADEVDYLVTYWGIRSRDNISRRTGRSISACKNKANELGLGGVRDNTNGFPIYQLSEIIGVPKTNLHKTWIDKHGLRTRKVGAFTVVSEKDLLEFMRTHQWLWDARKCDYYYFYTNDWFIEKLNRERDKGQAETKVKKWTEYEEKELLRLRHQGLSFGQIAKKMNRSKQSIYRKWTYLSGIIYKDVFEG